MEDNKELCAKDDEKYVDSDSELVNHEVVVHDQDLRQPIHELGNAAFRKMPFIKCIGQLRIEYNYPKKNYKISMSGTGTVIKTNTMNGYFSAATAFVLSAAHNARRTVWKCCNKYFEKKQKKKKIKNCKICHKLLNKKTDSILIKATSIEFQRRVTGNVEFGKQVESYECKIEYLNEPNYSAFPFPTSGFDWLLLSFIDNGNYYWKHCKNIKLEAMNISAKRKCNKFMIIGYPGEKGKEMWGYKMKQNAETIEFKTNEKTQNIYLCHKEIDATPGQSGAAIATQIHDKIIIFGVHSGGNATNKYNVATLLSEDIIGYINSIINGTQKQKTSEEVSHAGSSSGWNYRAKNNILHGITRMDEEREMLVGVMDQKSFGHACIVICYFCLIDSKLLVNRVFRIELFYDPQTEENVLSMIGPCYKASIKRNYRIKDIFQVQTTLDTIMLSAENVIRKFGGFKSFTNNSRHYANAFMSSILNGARCSMKKDLKFDQINEYIHKYCDIESEFNNNSVNLTFEQVLKKF